MHDFTVLVLPGTYPSSVTVTLDILSAAAVLAHKSGCARPRWRVLSASGKVALGHGLTLDAAVLPRTPCADSSTWIVPGLGLASPGAVMQGLARPDAARAMAALQAQAGGGGTLAASCSGVFLLQEAGLLGGRRVTTSWWLAPLLRQREPACVVDANRTVIDDGTVVTAGAAFAQADLMLHLLRKRFRPALADAVARALLIDGRQSQAQFIVPAMLADGNDLVAQLVAHFEAALPHPPSIAALAAHFGMSERTLARHVRAATGCTTSSLLQHARLARARMLLESSKLTVEQVAERVGYADTTALRRTMRKVMGATPRQFRPAAA